MSPREIINIQSIKREFNCIEFSQNEQRFLFAGTTSADFLIIDHKNKCLQATVSLGSLGVTQIASLAGEQILVGCGNGLLGKYAFDSKNWMLAAQVNFKHRINSLSVANGEILVVTNLTQALVVPVKTMQPFLLQESHKSRAAYVRFKDGDNNLFGVASDDSSIRLWDLQSRTVKGSSI